MSSSVPAYVGEGENPPCCFHHGDTENGHVLTIENSIEIVEINSGVDLAS